MKRLLIRVLAVFGLAPARVVATQARLIEELKAGSAAWKVRAGDAMARAKSLEAELKEHKKLADRAKIEAEKSVVRDAAFTDLKERLASAERELVMAREHLMAIEVKLDILEGAANVLDVRTRTAIGKQPRQSGAPV
jgi:hypothetical protein